MAPRMLPTAIAAGLLLILTGCATPDATSDPTSVQPASTSGQAHLGAQLPEPPPGELVALGTVIDAGGEAKLCLGAIMESYPPQCDGIPLSAWSWEGLGGFETSGDVHWGGYAVYGTYDGSGFTSTQSPISLALYDAAAEPDPTGGATGATPEDQLVGIQELLPTRLGSSYVGSRPDRGYLWVDVVWDDGTLQRAADAEFGADVVVIRSAMRELR